ncbi:malonate decarboxylase holo-ACP synthase [Pseudomonas fakonensis]|uniref:Malonate decarboxylase holo-ACP synthase n=1 Tax=Pseudomonas fakonensis TaxID=2842355 RepID=A0ABX8ND73_9PSED|nr:malonate decarboxylase holo-ACP synthase [Pseudomonas fakonensis]QXH53939.1 malonate decarboxylase holo-ACP synthase [Pseudomonas fakonensis]
MSAPRAHDLLWGMTPQMLADDAPQWAAQVLAAGQPVVVRRARCRDGWVAVGVRGQGRAQRWGGVMREVDIQWQMSPEDLLGGCFAPQSRHKAAPTGANAASGHALTLWEQLSCSIFKSRLDSCGKRPCVAIGLQSSPGGLASCTDSKPALDALASIIPVLATTGLHWGPTGGVGYHLATGLDVLHAGSDLDVLLRTPTPFTRQAARNLLDILDCAPCRIDLQLETPAGAIALREWAGPANRVLLKSASGARLVSDPWSALECAA